MTLEGKYFSIPGCQIRSDYIEVRTSRILQILKGGATASQLPLNHVTNPGLKVVTLIPTEFPDKTLDISDEPT